MSRVSTSSSVMKMRAAAEVAGAKEQAKFECLIAEKENIMRQRKAEEEKVNNKCAHSTRET